MKVAHDEGLLVKGKKVKGKKSKVSDFIGKDKILKGVFVLMRNVLCFPKHFMCALFR